MAHVTHRVIQGHLERRTFVEAHVEIFASTDDSKRPRRFVGDGVGSFGVASHFAQTCACVP